MKTIAKAARDSGLSEKLIRSTIKQLGDKETLEDVYKGGADAGFCGFTYYGDTVNFYKRNRDEINSRVIEIAKEYGDLVADECGFFKASGDPVKMVGSWRCMQGQNVMEIGRVIYGGRLGEDSTYIANGLAWFALEEVARAMCDE
jgi:hypothetical protein